jgi:hypothetical protein
MEIFQIILCFVIPAIIVFFIQRFSMSKLRPNEFILQTPKPFFVFSSARLLYWYIFAVMIMAFLLAMLLYSGNGNETRQMIAYKTTTGAPVFILEQASVIFLPLIFITLFTAMVALAVIGRSVLKQMPEEGKPTERFTRFRFTFVLMALSLIIPPLAFGSLLLL